MARAVAGVTTLRIGTTDHTSTAALQRRLAERGHNPGPVDGLYGLRTAAAVAGFQSAEGLTVDGVAGPVTLGALGLLSSGTPVDSGPATQPTGAYVTPLEAIAPPRWVQASPGLWLTAEPLRDAATGLFARLTYQGALDACAALGAALATPQDIIALRDDAAAGRAVALAPVTLPTVAMVRAAGCTAPPGSTVFESAAQGLRVHHMRSEAWCRAHDSAVADALTAARWDGVQRVSGAGKHWVAGAPPGRAYLMGWWAGRAWIQPPPLPGSRGPHDRGHTDYSMTTIARRVTPPGPPQAEPDPRPERILSPNFSRGRPSGPPRIIVLHTTENPCEPGVARAVARYLARPATQASAHYVVGPDACFQCVDDGDRAWHVGAPGNAFTIGIEQTGRASFTPAEWDTPNARAMLARVVALAAGLCARWAIPAVLLSAEDVRAGRAGIATHAAIGRGVGGTDHYDPGPAYPLASVVERIAARLRALSEP